MNKSSTDEDNQIVAHQPVPIQKSSQEESDSTNINSDSLSSSILNDSSNPSVSHIQPKKFAKGKINEYNFMNVVPEHVKNIPWNVNGNKIYVIECAEKNFISKYQDSHWFVLKDSKRHDLNGIHKTGRCQGSLICVRPDCPKLTTEDVVNMIDFKRQGNNMYVCTSCGYLVSAIYCGCRKVVEYNRDHKVLTYYHEGTHICNLKPNVAERRKALE